MLPNIQDSSYTMAFTTNAYSFAFIGAYGLINETIVVAELYQKERDWKTVSEIVKNKNLLHKVKEGTVIREFREIRKRLVTLSELQLSLLVKGDLSQTKAMILVSVAKTYEYIYDFIIEVLRSKYLRRDTALLESDYQRFIDSKSIIHPEIESLTDKSKHKIRLVMLQILSQLGLLTDGQERTIIGQMLGEEVLSVIVQDDPKLLRLFFFSDNDVEINRKKYQ